MEAVRKGGSRGEEKKASGSSNMEKKQGHVPQAQILPAAAISPRDNVSARRRGNLKGKGSVASGGSTSSKTKKKPVSVSEAQNLPVAAISRQENRKRVLEERRKEDDKSERDDGRMIEVGDGALSLGVGKTTSDDRPEPLLVQALFGDDIKGIIGGKDDSDPWAGWETNFEEPPTAPEVKRKESIEEWEMRLTEQSKASAYLLETDYQEHRSSIFRGDWEFLWSRDFGAFEDITRIPAMRFTFKPPDGGARLINTLQVFSAKVAATRCGLQLPLDVFGMIAIRDRIDNNRNIIFSRTRDNCQTLTKEYPYLVLTGPTRAVVMMECVTIEVDLRVKGTVNAEDEQLSSLAVPILSSDSSYSCLWSNLCYTSKLSTMEFTLGPIAYSVEATIFVQVTRGSWPDGTSGQFSATASGLCCEIPSSIYYHASVDDEEIMLLDTRGERVPVNSDGRIELSRCVVSVDTRGELKVYAKAWGDDNSFTKKWKGFKPLKAGKSVDTIDIGFCAMDVTVFWSLVSDDEVYADEVL